MPDFSGRSLRGSFAFCCPGSSSWRTSQLSLLTELPEEFCGTWPTSGTMRNGVLCQRKPWAVRSSASDGSASRGVVTWPTVKTGTGGANSQREQRGAGGPDLQEAVKLWSTARSEDGERGKGSRFDGLSEDVQSWATVTAKDGSSSGNRNGPGSKAHKGESLTDQVRTMGPVGPSVQPWAAPTANDAKNGSLPPSQMERAGAAGERVSFVGPMAPPSGAMTENSDGSPKTSPSVALNPRFSLWLQGFPVTWLDSMRSATRSVRKSRSKSGTSSLPLPGEKVSP